MLGVLLHSRCTDGNPSKCTLETKKLLLYCVKMPRTSIEITGFINIYILSTVSMSVRGAVNQLTAPPSRS